MLNKKEAKELFYQPNSDEMIKEIKEGIYNRHFVLNRTPFAYVFFDKVLKTYENMISKELSQKDVYQIESKLLEELHKDKNFFFYDNTNTLYMINYTKFDSFDKDSFYNSIYYKKCIFKGVPYLNNSNEELANEFDEKVMIEDIESKLSKIDKKNFLQHVNDTDILFIHDKESLDYFLLKSSKFKIISLDLEGRLRKLRPDINLIQICDNVDNNTEIFVIDMNSFVHDETLNKTLLPIILSKLKHIFEDPDIVKLFFDGRSDLVSLHVQFSICMCNYIALSSLFCAAEAFKEQLTLDKEKQFGSYIKSLYNSFTNKGLNTVLHKYHSEHKANELKEKFHELFEKESKEIFTKRPINEEFLYYSAIDVEYLYDTYMNLRNTIKGTFEALYSVKDDNKFNNNMDIILNLISSGHLQVACSSFLTVEDNK